MIAKRDLPACPVATTIKLIGNKWKLLLLQEILPGAKRFGELQKSLEGISQKVLTDNLREMESDGIVTRTAYAEVPPRVEYSVSELGETLRPVLNAMGIWGEEYKNIYGNE